MKKFNYVIVALIAFMAFSTVYAADLQSCIDTHTNDLACGSVYFIPQELPFFTHLIMNLIKIVVPIVLILKGFIDIIKAVTGNNEDAIVKARSKFFKRLIPALSVFLVILLVQFIFDIIASDDESTTFSLCVDCFLNNDCAKTPQEKTQDYCKELYEDGNGGQGGGGGGQGGGGGSTTPSIPPNLTDPGEIGKYVVEKGREMNKTHNSEFKYLGTDLRDDYKCFEKLFQNKKCTTSSGGECETKDKPNTTCTHYGGDCNAYTSWVIYNALGIPADSEYKYAYPCVAGECTKAPGEWVSTTNYYKRVAIVEDAYNNTDKIEQLAKPGDLLGRVCSPTTYTHIGIYAGDGKALENCGSCTGGPMNERDLKSFIRIKPTSDYNYSKCKITILRLDVDEYNKFRGTSDGGGGSGNTNFTWTDNAISKLNSKKISIPSTESCKNNGNICKETYDDGYVKTIDGVLYFQYKSDYNGTEATKGTGTKNINKVFSDRLDKFFAAADAAGYTIWIGEQGWRSVQDQKYFYCCYTGEGAPITKSDGQHKCTGKNTCNINPATGTAWLASKESTSPHGWGIAADLDFCNGRNNKSCDKDIDAVIWAHQNAEKYGLTFNVKDEDYHIEPLYVCEITDAGSKYSSCKKSIMYYCSNDSTRPSGAATHEGKCGRS